MLKFITNAVLDYLNEGSKSPHPATKPVTQPAPKRETPKREAATTTASVINQQSAHEVVERMIKELQTDRSNESYMAVEALKLVLNEAKQPKLTSEHQRQLDVYKQFQEAKERNWGFYGVDPEGFVDDLIEILEKEGR